ncbi:MAG: trypsin-like peptidase domain-containing protein [Rhodocyclaceae bacterium]|nr:trypsin-like peptidase domain-containing protein [Rhodocyclaceae bacterium]
MNPENTLYAVLGVAADAGAAEIEAAHAARLRSLQGDADALSLLRVAYDTLRDPAQRAAYDRRLARRQADAGVALAGDGPPRARLRNWLLLAAVVGGSAFFLAASPPKVAAPPAPEISLADEPQALPSPAPVAAEEVPLPASAEPQNAPTEASPVAAAAVLQPPPRRGSKNPGFDAQYVAWSVFAIHQRNKSGSGVLIAPDRILTNCHVLAGAASNGMVAVHGLTGRSVRVEKYARLDDVDACLLLAPGAGGEAVEWGSSAALRPGDTVHAMGHPGGIADVAWSEGPFRQRTERGGETFLLSENYCRPGSSGGPLLDGEGRLVGIVTAVQRIQSGGEAPRFGACISVTEAAARALLAKPLFPIALAPAQYLPR